MLKPTLITALWLLFFCANAQISGIVNIYTPVLQFDCDSSLLTVGSASGFGAGDKVLLIQMQGATVDLSNTNNFGTILDPGNAGNYEFNRIASTSGNTVQLKYGLSKPYDVAGKVQLIRVPQYIDVTATNLTCKPWDGSTGGVLVMNVVNKLILNGNVDVSSKGFRGGLLENGSNISSHETQYYYPPNPKFAAAKGEGVAVLPMDKSYGRGRAANGGGGGNAHNAGGGGGAHIGAGGKGGLEYFNTPGNPTAGTDGLGGQEIFSNNVDRLLMGGGGGAGQANDNQGSSGGNGGGIIFLNALKIESNNFNLLAKGEDVFGPGGDLVNDGQGGGGAGGTIILNTGEVTGALACIASGGRGGDCLFYVNTQIIGPGGGGGGGRIAGLSNLLTYATVDVSPGQPGIANQNNHNGASAGQAGKIFTNFVPTEDFATAFQLQPINIKVDVPYCNKPGKIEVLNETGALYNINNGQQQSSPVFNDIYAGTYTIQAWKNGCHKDTTIILEESPYSIGYSDLLLCRGETVTINGVVYNSAATVVDTIATSSGCDSLHVTNITLDDGPETFLGADSLICPGTTIVLNSPYPETYWNGSILGTIFEVTMPGTVYAKAKNEQGCWINDTVQILQCCSLKTIYVPNVFTPGSTDENSQFCIFPSPSCSEILLRVYDRWGSLVYESRQADNCWDGSWRGKEAASGVYVWVLEFFSNESRQHSVIRGDVTLLR
jgi:gliding motility-associated-like protein